jgi:DnaJ-class molecular chaperone
MSPSKVLGGEVMYTKDYYRIMGLSGDTSEQEIKRTYRKLAMQYHPDRNRDDPYSAEKLKEINDAYHVLENKERRMTYDLMYHRRIEDDLFQGMESAHTDLESVLRRFAARQNSSSWRPSCRRKGERGRGCGKWRQKS